MLKFEFDDRKGKKICRMSLAGNSDDIIAEGLLFIHILFNKLTERDRIMLMEGLYDNAEIIFKLDNDDDDYEEEDEEQPSENMVNLVENILNEHEKRKHQRD